MEAEGEGLTPCCVNVCMSVELKKSCSYVGAQRKVRKGIVRTNMQTIL